MALEIGFIQVVRSKEIKEFMTRVLNEVSKKHSHILNTILMEDNISFPAIWTSDVTNSTTAPFSDKLMMFHVSMLLNSTIFFYGAALSTCMRKDLASNYMAFISKDLVVSEDAAEIMIDQKWLEQPPQTINHEALSNTSG